MENTVYIALSRQIVVERQLDVIANNLANATTTGYKAQNNLFTEFLNRAQPRQPLSYVQDAGTFRDYAPGPIENTGNDLDVAIAGEGFFAVQTPNGVRYTREGKFSLNAQGQLVSAAGYPVLGGGTPISIDPAEGQIKIAADGTVSTDSARNGQFLAVVGKIDVVRFSDPQKLESAGNNLLLAPPSASAQPVLKPGLAQRGLEQSNVKPVLELTALIDASRSYESVGRFIQNEYDRQQKAIQTLAGTPTNN
ncbi:MAG TPA: flagellar basal-body rod protein FlgF [Dongiaceae bacterium]|nr:flagellar basal-body rod protein FlgF [Dongiaceae bacterium]